MSHSVLFIWGGIWFAWEWRKLIFGLLRLSSQSVFFIFPTREQDARVVPTRKKGEKGVRSVRVAAPSAIAISHIVKIMQMREPFLRKRKKMSIQMGWGIFPGAEGLIPIPRR